MTTTEHAICLSLDGEKAWCGCGTFDGTYGSLTRHLLDAGRDEGRDEGYAAGLAAAKGELVAADDVPRIDDANKHACTGVRAVEGFVQAGRTGGLYAAGYDVSVQADRVYLLAEAPDPDAEVLAAMRGASYSLHARAERADPLPGLPEYGDFLAALRERNYDVVKAVAK